MKKSTYVFIYFILSLNFWSINPIIKILNKDIILIIAWIWIFLAFIIFRGKKRDKNLYSLKYIKYVYWIFLGVCISMLSAYFFWKQDLVVTFLAQRSIYSFVMLPTLLFIQPTERDIEKGLKWISVSTIFIWIIVAINPKLISIDIDESLQSNSEFGYYVDGIRFVLLYFYLKVYKFIIKVDMAKFLELSVLLIFIFLFQNRSIFFGVFIAVIFLLIKFRSNYKPIITIFFICTILIAIIYTTKIWMELFEETISQLNDPNYNRWKSLHYYLFEYSPNGFCYIFGNGFPSGGNSSFGNLMWDNFKIGFYASDLGLIGMWTDYGVIPLMAIYLIVIKLLINKEYPMYLKFVSLHILLIPTIFSFWENSEICFFVLIFYMYAYYSEQNRHRNAFYSNSKLQERTTDNKLYSNGIN